MMKPILYTSPYSLRHDTGHGHPESLARIEMLEDLFETAPFQGWEQKLSSAATDEQIEYAHNQDYIFELQDKIPEHGLAAIDGDTILSPESYNAALHGAGAVCDAVDMIMVGTEHSPTSGQNVFNKAFCATRPPGHHAEPNTAMGFCLFNNIFIGARHAQEEYDIKKIVILDFDVHHGNGTETMCRAHNKAHKDKPILYISSHGYPLFPMTGDPAENDETCLNIRLPEDCGSEAFRALYEEQVFPVLQGFAPDFIMLSAGFDAHIDDPLAPINLKTEDYTWLTRKLCDIADQHAQSRIVSVLEGGYDLGALKECVQVHLQELAR